MTERQLMLIEDLRPDVISCTPSYALTLAQAFEERGVRPDDLSLRLALLGAEPWTEAMRREIDARLGVRAVNLFGLSEVIGPGVSCECVEERDGAHVNEDHFLPEIVDPWSGEPRAEGEEGVLVFTTLTKQALPLIRYWTGDVCSLSSEPCPCGRTLVRMSRIKGRTDDMLIIRGVNVYPTQVESVLLRVPELMPSYRIVVSRTRHARRGGGRGGGRGGVVADAAELRERERSGYSREHRLPASRHAPAARARSRARRAASCSASSTAARSRQVRARRPRRA